MVKKNIDYRQFRDNINGITKKVDKKNSNGTKTKNGSKQTDEKKKQQLRAEILETLEVSPMTFREVAKQIKANGPATEKELKALQKEEIVTSTWISTGISSVLYWGLKSKV